MPKTNTKYKKVVKDDVEYYRARGTIDGHKYDLTAKTPAALDEKIDDLKYKIRSGDTIDSPNVTVAAWAREWLETYKKPVVIEKSYKLYRTNVNKYIIPEIGGMKLSDVQPIHLQRILASQTGRSFSHVSHIRCALTGMFSDALKNNKIIKNPAKELIMPKTTKGTHRCMTDDEVRVMLKVCETHYMGLLPLFMYYCGLRPNEVAALSYNDIDTDRKMINVTKAVESDKKSLKQPKTNAGEREVPIPEKFLERLKSEATGKAPHTYIIADKKGRVCTAKYLQNCWENIIRRMDIESGAKLYNNKIIESKLSDDLTLYCIRHTYCTNLQRAGVPMNVAKYLMGHNNVDMIAQIYGHQTADQTAAAKKLYDDYLHKTVSKTVRADD